jgi:hypothetical protein
MRNVAKYGHIAARLREVLQQRGWKPGDLNRAIGHGAGHTSVYAWLAARGAPGPAIRGKVAAVTGIPVAELMMREAGAQALAPPPRALGAPQRVSAATRGSVLSFEVGATGEARIKLDIVLPLELATPLLRMLLDAGLVFTPADTG